MSTSNDQALQFISHYRVERLLGEGGAARTWLANDERDGTRLAIKELQLLSAGGAKQEELFERECSTLRELRHPQIPRFIETIVERRAETMSLYLIQEFIDGLSLQQILDSGVALSPQDTVAVMRSCLSPLSYLHERQPPLYHRDIKPSNVLVRRDGTCVLVDFGAVREALADPRAGGSSVVGTFGYMAPEQFQARAYAATDLYALGAMAIHLLTGREPSKFEIRRLKPDFHAHLQTDPHLAAILDLLLEPAAEDRYRDAHALRRALDRWSSRYGGEESLEERLRGLLTRAELNRTPAVEAAPEPVAPAPEPVVSTIVSVDEIFGLKPATAQLPAIVAVESPSEISEVGASSVEIEPIDLPIASGPPPVPTSAAATAEVSLAPAPAPASADEAGEILRSYSSTQLPAVPPRSTITQRRAVTNDTEAAFFLEAFVPGGQGAPAIGMLFMLVGIGLAAWGQLGGLEYNAGVYTATGVIVAIVGLLQLAVPRWSVARTDPALKTQGVTTAAVLHRLIRRSNWLGATEFIVEYEYMADDGLHYTGRLRLPNAAAAKQVTADSMSAQARYLPYRPDLSQLLLRK
jgi:serine/threonine protein kinase